MSLYLKTSICPRSLFLTCFLPLIVPPLCKMAPLSVVRSLRGGARSGRTLTWGGTCLGCGYVCAHCGGKTWLGWELEFPIVQVWLNSTCDRHPFHNCKSKNNFDIKKEQDGMTEWVSEWVTEWPTKQKRIMLVGSESGEFDLTWERIVILPSVLAFFRGKIRMDAKKQNVNVRRKSKYRLA